MTSEVKENNTFYANFVQRNINYPRGIDVAKKKRFACEIGMYAMVYQNIILNIELQNYIMAMIVSICTWSTMYCSLI